MHRPLALAAFLIFICSHASANEPGPPPITRQTLVGTWEAVSPYNPFVYRLNIAADQSSYLVWMWDSHPMMCRMVYSDVRAGKVTLRFRPMRGSDISFDQLTITATGYGDATLGVMTGKLRIKRPDDDDYVENVGFARPPWVAWLPKVAATSEQLLKRARREKQ